MSEPRLWCAKCGRGLRKEPYEHSADVYKVQPCGHCARETAKQVFEAGTHFGIALALGQDAKENCDEEHRARNFRMQEGSDMDHHDWSDKDKGPAE